MAEVKVKTKKEQISSRTKMVGARKSKLAHNSSSNDDVFVDEETEDFSKDEAENLLEKKLKVTETGYDGNDDYQELNNFDHFQPIDKLISPKLLKRKQEAIFSGTSSENDIQEYVLIGCRFPNGVVLNFGKTKMLLRGINDMPNPENKMRLGTVGFTKIVKNRWDKFIKTHENWPPLVKGSVFVVDGKHNY